MTEYVGLRPKTYPFEIDREEYKRAKDVRKSVVETNLTFADHKECLDTGKEKYRSMNIIRSRLHQVLTLETCKKPLSTNDDKVTSSPTASAPSPTDTIESLTAASEAALR